MKLAVDTHHLLLEHAGTKRVTLNILEQFRKDPQIELVELEPAYSLKSGKGVLAKLAGHIIRFFWVQIHLPYLCRVKHVDFLLSPEFYSPIFTSCKRGVIAHDAHIRAQRQFISPLWFYFYYIPFIEYAIRRADLIFTVSKFSKGQISSLMRLDDSKVHVAYNGVDRCFTGPARMPSGDVVSETGLSRGKYILFVGTFEARKNIERLIRAFALFRAGAGARGAGMKLAIAGKPSSGQHSDRNQEINGLVDSLHLRDEIVLCGFVPDADLPAFYKGAAMVAFPSLYEGFGLPIIEGFASNVPVMTSAVCSMPEIAGDAALLCDPYDVRDMASKMELLLFDVPLRERLISVAQERVKVFTWELCASQILFQIRRSLSISQI
ncbi:MAG: glycosyltransferase family 4 protein [Daejeonella sp.]